MRKFILGLAIAAMAVPATSPALADPGGHGHHGDRGNHGGRHDNGRHNGWGNGRGNTWQSGRHYDWNRPDPRYGGYDASRYYHPGSYRERRLTRYDRISRFGRALLLPPQRWHDRPDRRRRTGRPARQRDRQRPFEHACYYPWRGRRCADRPVDRSWQRPLSLSVLPVGLTAGGHLF